MHCAQYDICMDTRISNRLGNGRNQPSWYTKNRTSPLMRRHLCILNAYETLKKKKKKKKKKNNNKKQNKKKHSTLGKIFSRRHIEIFFIFFPRKQVLTFQNPFSGKNKKNIFNVSSPELARRVETVKQQTLLNSSSEHGSKVNCFQTTVITFY